MYVIYIIIYIIKSNISISASYVCVLKSYHHDDKRKSNEDVGHGKRGYACWDEEGQTNCTQTNQGHGQGKTQEGHKGGF